MFREQDTWQTTHRILDRHAADAVMAAAETVDTLLDCCDTEAGVTLKLIVTTAIQEREVAERRVEFECV